MLTVQTLNSAPTAAKPLMEGAQKKFGMVPNLLGVLANAPAVLEGYLTLSGIFDKTSFRPLERQVVLMTSNFTNNCDYCMAAHTTIADMQNLDRSVIDAIRDDTPIADDKLEALRLLTADVVASRGYPKAATIEAFISAGYKPEQVLEIIMGVALKVMSNYTNHVAETPVDAAFSANSWRKKGKSAA